MKQLFELRRQIAHVIFGLTLIIIYQRFNLSIHYLLLLLIVGIICSLIAKKRKIPIIHQFLLIFEREKHIKRFPGRGIIYFVLGSYLTLLLFSKHIALTSILILTLGDAFTNLVGFYFGKKVHLLNKKKTWEGSLGGFVVSFMGAMFFVDLLPALVASLSAIIIEAPQFKIGRLEIDDNILIPLTAGATLMFFF